MDRITSVTPPSPASAISYTWDNNGDLTGRGGDSFAWDYEDRMTSATVNSTTTTFAYRGDGLRNSRTMGGVTTTFRDIAGGLPVVLDDGARYVYGAGLVSQVSGANTYYYLADGLGSTMKTVDARGKVVNGYTYDVYGKKTSSSGSQANEFDFAGQQTDPTGLQYLRARYYDPETGTFMSRDPMSTLPGWTGNPLGYAGANAVNRTDPTGLWCVGPLCLDGDGVSVGGHEVVEGAKYGGNAETWAANVLNVLSTVNPALRAIYIVATLASAAESVHQRDYISALLTLATYAAGPQWIIPLILLNYQIHDMMDPHPAGDPCDYDAVTQTCDGEQHVTVGEYA